MSKKKMHSISMSLARTHKWERTFDDVTLEVKKSFVMLQQKMGKLTTFDDVLKAFDDKWTPFFNMISQIELLLQFIVCFFMFFFFFEN